MAAEGEGREVAMRIEQRVLRSGGDSSAKELLAVDITFLPSLSPNLRTVILIL